MYLYFVIKYSIFLYFQLKEELSEVNSAADSANTKNLQDIDFYKEETEKAQTEIESLQQKLKDFESEKDTKDATIKDLQE